MALITERLTNVREGWLTVDVEYDDVTLRVQTITVTPNVPPGYVCYAAIHRGGSQQPWREATFDSSSSTYQQSRPFGGGFNNRDQIEGIETSYSRIPDQYLMPHAASLGLSFPTATVIQQQFIGKRRDNTLSIAPTFGVSAVTLVN